MYSTDNVKNSISFFSHSDWQMSRAEYTSPQNWRPPPNQSATALVSPRILGRPSRPISTLQEVTSEDEERDITQEVIRAATPHFLYPQPAPRQRSFSCTQHALNRRSSANQPELYTVTPVEKTNEHVEIVIVPQSKEASHQSENKTAGNIPSSAQTEPVRDNSRNSNYKIQNERINNEPNISIQTTMWEKKRKLYKHWLHDLLFTMFNVNYYWVNTKIIFHFLN